MVTLIGSVPTGRAVMRAAAETLKPVLLELGGKNALIALQDADPDEVATNAVAGMNFTWCGQSCGSMSRVFLHDSIHDAVVARIKDKIAHYKPGLPTDPATTMGAIVSQAQHQRVMGYIRSAQEQGAELVCGGGPPNDPALANGWFIEPTVFAGVTQSMRIASEEIFGPVQSILRWTSEAAMLADVNSVEYGLTCAIFTNDLDRAHRLAAQVEGRLRLDQPGRRPLPGRPLRRREAIRHRPRGMPGRDDQLHAGKEHPHPATPAGEEMKFLSLPSPFQGEGGTRAAQRRGRERVLHARTVLRAWRTLSPTLPLEGGGGSDRRLEL